MKAGNIIIIEIGETEIKPHPNSPGSDLSYTKVNMTVNGENKEGSVIISPAKYANDENVLAQLMKDPFIYKNLK